MMAGSIQLAVPSQLRLCEMPPVWFTLDEEEEDEDEDEELGSPPKLMLMLGKSALSPSCHSFTFRLSTEVLFSVWEGDTRVSKQPRAQIHRRRWRKTGEMKKEREKKKKSNYQIQHFICTTKKAANIEC